MHAVERWLIACISMDRCHIAALNPNCVVKDFCDRRQAVCRARCVRDDKVICAQCLVVYTVNNCLIRTAGRRRDKDALRSRFQVGCGFFFRGEDTGALKGDINAHFAMWKLFRVANGGALKSSATNFDAVAVYLYGFIELPVNRVVLQEVGICFHRAQIVDRDDFNVCAIMLDD